MNGERSSADPTEVEPQTGAGVSAALIAGLVVVHLAMAYSFSTLPDLVHDLVEPIAGPGAADLVVDVLPLLPLALVVLGVGRTLGRGVAACVVVLAVAVVAHLVSPSWVVTALLPLGAALAWGVARRYGAWWLAGLVLAPLVALLFRWLDLDGFSDAALRASFRAFVLHVVPAVVAGLACWALEWRENPGQRTGPATPRG
jgi:hypothetical protein